jgi:hypothetical protein
MQRRTFRSEAIFVMFTYKLYLALILKGRSYPAVVPDLIQRHYSDGQLLLAVRLELPKISYIRCGGVILSHAIKITYTEVVYLFLLSTSCIWLISLLPTNTFALI